MGERGVLVVADAFSSIESCCLWYSCHRLGSAVAPAAGVLTLEWCYWVLWMEARDIIVGISCQTNSAAWARRRTRLGIARESLGAETPGFKYSWLGSFSLGIGFIHVCAGKLPVMMPYNIHSNFLIQLFFLTSPSLFTPRSAHLLKLVLFQKLGNLRFAVSLFTNVSPVPNPIQKPPLPPLPAARKTSPTTTNKNIP